jgi:hypothetical protein
VLPRNWKSVEHVLSHQRAGSIRRPRRPADGRLQKDEIDLHAPHPNGPSGHLPVAARADISHDPRPRQRIHDALTSKPPREQLRTPLHIASRSIGFQTAPARMRGLREIAIEKFSNRGRRFSDGGSCSLPRMLAIPFACSTARTRSSRHGHLPYNGQAGYRDGAQVPVGEHRQRRRGGRTDRRARRDGTPAPTELWELPARHRPIRERAPHPDAAGGDPHDDRLGGDAPASGQPRDEHRRQLGRRHDLRLRRARGQGVVREADGISDRHRVGARQWRRDHGPRAPHRCNSGTRLLGPGAS